MEHPHLPTPTDQHLHTAARPRKLLRRQKLPQRPYALHPRRQDTQPQNSMRSPSSSSHASQSPTKAPFAYSATSQDQALPTNYAQLSKIIADAIAHHEQGRRNRSTYSSQDSSSGSSYTNNSRSRDRDKSRDRSRDRREDNRRSDSRPSRERDERGDNNGRGQKGRDSYTRRDSSQPRSPIDHQRGDRSPSSERKPTDASGQQNKYK